MIAAAIRHRSTSTTALDRHVDDALQHEGFAHLAALALKHDHEPDGPLVEVVDLAHGGAASEQLPMSNANLPTSNLFVRQ